MLNAFVMVCHISIHALREEGDGRLRFRWSWRQDFNPRPPRGGRLVRWEVALPQFIFQSTPSARRATGRIDAQASDIEISIHALREEGDYLFLLLVFDVLNFNPRPPRGGRP